MTSTIPVPYLYVAALAWGLLWGATLQFTAVGQWLAARRTWVTVVIGVGVDLLLFLPFLSPAQWIAALAIVTFSSIGVIARSLANEHTEDDEQLGHLAEAFRD